MEDNSPIRYVTSKFCRTCFLTCNWVVLKFDLRSLNRRESMKNSVKLKYLLVIFSFSNVYEAGYFTVFVGDLELELLDALFWFKE